MYQAGQKIIRVIECAGIRTASFQRIESDDGVLIRLQDIPASDYGQDGHEINQTIPGVTTYLVDFDGDQEERVRYDGDPATVRAAPPRRKKTKVKLRSASRRTVKKTKRVKVRGRR